MNIKIHRGTHQIGGCVTEYEYNGWHLFVDYGEQLLGYPQTDPLEVNCLTNPIAVTILFFLTRSSVGTVTEQVIVLFIEAVVVVTEGMIYKRRLSEQKRNPFLLSFILNAASYGTGIALELLSVPV